MDHTNRYSLTMRIGPVLAVLILAAFLAPAAGAASPANYGAASQDGAVAFFSTVEQLVPGDTDNRQDVYQRSYDSGLGDYVTREVSTGAIGGNDAYDAVFERAGADGQTVFFSTFERLVSSDTDAKRDIYVRELGTGVTKLVSAGASSCLPACGNGGNDVGFAGATRDGESVFFVTAESLASGDTDASVDIYERRLATDATSLVSVGASSCLPACGNGADEATLWAVSPSGSQAYFATAERLSGSDTDSVEDIYARDLASGSTVLVSAGNSACLPACGNGASVPIFRGSSDDGSTVFFITDEPLAPADSDTATDVYSRDLSSGSTTLVSPGTDPSLTSSFAAASSDGSTVFFTTAEGLVGADSNEATDVYRRSGAGPELVTSGTCSQGSDCGSTFNDSSPDGDTVLFSTTEPLVSGDTDADTDVYSAEAPGWSPVLLSIGEAGCLPACGNGAAPSIFKAAPDGSTVFFTTSESLSPLDVDAGVDIYLRNVAAGSTALSSPAGICPKKEACDSVFRGSSTDAAHVFFQTDERLTAEDIDSESDVYERFGGETRIVSVGNSTPVGPPTPFLTGTDPASLGESTTPTILGQADLDNSVKIYTQSGCTGSPIATGTSLELGSGGIQVTVAVGSTTSFYATATDVEGDTSPCSPPVTYTQANAEPPPPPPPPTSEPPPPPPPAPTDQGSGGSKGGGGKSGGSGSKGNGDKGGGGVAYVSPQTLITFGPGNKTRKRRPVFRFTDATEQPGTSFYCRIDHLRWQSCSSPQKLRRLGLGKHVFKVKAQNAVGDWSSSSVKRAFQVVK